LNINNSSGERIFVNGTNSFTGKTTKFNLDNLNLKSVKSLNINLKNPYNNLNSINSLKLSNNLNSSFMVEKLSALLHDFKHIVYDNIIYFDFLISKYLDPIKNDTEMEIKRPNFGNVDDNLICLTCKKIENQKFKEKSKDKSFINYFQESFKNYLEKKDSIFQESFKNFFENKDSVGEELLKNNFCKCKKFLETNYSITKNNKIHEEIQNSKNKRIINTQNLNDELTYLNVMKDYTISLVLNITNFISDNDFLPTKFEEVDLQNIINLMIKIFNRRLEFENNKNNDNSFIGFHRDSIGNLFTSKKFKNLEISSNIQNSDNPLYKKLVSNKNLIICLFYNILSNSFKYTHQGEIQIETSIIQKGDSNVNDLLNNCDTIFVKISDSGNGIPEDILNNWGKPFNFKDKTKGTGLGQFLISLISKKLGLRIPKPEKNNDSSTKTGTIFKIYFPIGRESNIESFSKKQIIYNNFNKNNLRNYNFSSRNQMPIQNKYFTSRNSVSKLFKKNNSINGMSLNNNNFGLNQNNLSNVNYPNNLPVINRSKSIKPIYSKTSSFYNFNKSTIILNNSPFNDEDDFHPLKNNFYFDYKKFMNSEFYKNNYSKNKTNNKINNAFQKSYFNDCFNDSNSSENINFEIDKIKERTIYILCLDDDQLFLSMLNVNLIKFAKENSEIKFEFIFVTNFKEYFIECIKLLNEGVMIDFFLLDQNISSSFSGYDISNITNFIYKKYQNNKRNENSKYHFLFITEDLKFMRNKNKMHSETNISIDKLNIFSKIQFKDILKRIHELISLMGTVMNTKTN